MENILTTIDSRVYEIDSDKTIEEYRQLISHFLNSDLFSYDPYCMSGSELDEILDKRATNKVHNCSWIGRTEIFFSRCHLESINHVNDVYPWDQLCFQPHKNFPVVTLNRFRRDGSVLMENEREVLPIWKKYEILGSTDDTTKLEYFKKSIGRPYVYCYSFDTLDDFSKQRLCLRFGEDYYKRESLLLTQLFSISYLINYPIACFPLPNVADMIGVVVDDTNAMSTLLSPILKENEPVMMKLQSKLQQSIIRHNLHAENIWGY